MEGEGQTPTQGQVEETGKKKKSAVLLIIALVLFILLTGGFMLIRQGGESLEEKSEITPVPTIPVDISNDVTDEDPSETEDEDQTSEEIVPTATPTPTFAPTNTPVPTVTGPGGFQAQPTNSPTVTPGLPLSN